MLRPTRHPVIPLAGSGALWLSFLFLGVLLTFGGCKSKKKVVENQPAPSTQTQNDDMAAKIRAAKEKLNTILNDQGQLSYERKLQMLNEVKAMNLRDAEVQDMIRRAEALLAEEARRRAEADAKTQADQAATTQLSSQLSRLMDDIALAPSTEAANTKISQALALFASPDAPVLVVIKESRNIVDYDEPSTISKYLHYLKDTKKKPYPIRQAPTDANGKIVELELSWQ